MAKMYYEADADLDLLNDKTVAVIGYGSQGHAHALNLKDSGVRVVVGLHKDSQSWAEAEQSFHVMTPDEAADAADTIMMLIPDHKQKEIYDSQIAPALKPGKTLMFAHGFSIHFNQIQPPSDVDVTMIAPKGPGHLVRRTFVEGAGVPALIAIQQDASGNAFANAMAYAKGIGAAKAGVVQTTFKEETETDLFGEQTVLCGGVTQLIRMGFETLVEAGYQPEIAYFECMHEMKLIVDLMYQGGMEYMRYSISDTAEYGDYTRGQQVITEDTKGRMKKVLGQIQDGSFAKEWIAENTTNGRQNFLEMRRAAKAHQIEQVGRELRGMMSWLKDAR